MDRDTVTPLDPQRRRSSNPYSGIGIKADASQAGTAVMGSGPRRRGSRFIENDGGAADDDDRSDSRRQLVPAMPALGLAFQKNLLFLRRIFSLDTFLSPLPPPVRFHVGRSIGSFLRIFTQFWDPRGIKNAQTAMGIRKEPSYVYRRRDD